jgi:hypothetical protein
MASKLRFGSNSSYLCLQTITIFLSGLRFYFNLLIPGQRRPWVRKRDGGAAGGDIRLGAPEELARRVGSL